MLSAARLKEQIQAYVSGQISLGDFEDWFYECSAGVIRNSESADLIAEVDAALSARLVYSEIARLGLGLTNSSGVEILKRRT
jgi:hypothetical protein